MLIIGVDIGFGFTKVTDGTRHRVFKSLVGEATDIQFRERFVASESEEPHLHLSVDDEAYFAGELAERQSSMRSFTLDQEQLLADFARRLALAGLSELVRDPEPIHLVTGLPIRHYQRHREALSRVLTGHHAVTRFDAGGNRTQHHVKVERVRVVPQPFGSLFQAMLNDMGRISAQRYTHEKIGIIDVGFRTADYSIADRTRYSERGSSTSDAGIAQALRLIASALQEQSGVSVELYRLYDAVAKGSIRIHGQRYDLTTVTERAFTRLAKSIAGEVNQLWSDDWDIDAVLLTGGGGAVLAPHLAPLLDHEVIPQAASDARTNNVLGYRKYGAHLWERPPK